MPAIFFNKKAFYYFEGLFHKNKIAPTSTQTKALINKYLGTL